MSDAGSLQKIRTMLGDNGYIDDPVRMEPYLTSWRNGWVGKSPLIAFPSSTAQVAELVTFCAKNKIAMVPQGGNTGLVGGGVPSQNGKEIVINLSRMNKIHSIDKVASTVTVEAGVILQTLQTYAADAGFLFPLSIAAEGSAEIGGLISTNAGGTAVLRYGNMRDLIVGIEAVTADGKIYSSLKKLPKDNTGYDLGRTFIGAEGTLGVVTGATLKLFPPLRQKVTSILALNNPAMALDLLAEFRSKAGEYLTAFELMPHAAIKLATKHISGARFPGKDDAPYYMLVEFGSTSQSFPLRVVFEDLAGHALNKNQILDAVIAENEAQAKQFWQLRENISESMRKEGQGIHFDISLPLDQIPDFLKNMEAQIKTVSPIIMPVPFGHIGDGNIHYNMYFAAPSPNFPVLKKRVQEIVYADVKHRHGSISAEHGIGVDRKAELLSYKSADEIAMMRKIKHALDPDGLMNPGKIFD
ncbi:MAG TPA: FAD-binding oxidoreductase [Alphaproteobacteria bacterium]|nr:FAD-binding oxidoreductase [Alphaproteobacteria bacterium]